MHNNYAITASLTSEGTLNNINDASASSTNNNTSNGNNSNNPKGRKKKASLPTNLKICENLTPPPTCNDGKGKNKSKQPRSEETPATISKLKRRRRGGRKVTVSPVLLNGFDTAAAAGGGTVNNGEGGKGGETSKAGVDGNTTTTSSSSSSNNNNNNNEIDPQQQLQQKMKPKISASQEVDRVFDFLGLPAGKSGHDGGDEGMSFSQQERGGHDQPKHYGQPKEKTMSQSHSQPNSNSNGLNATTGAHTNAATSSSSPINQRRLFDASSKTTNAKRLMLKLPPLRTNVDRHTDLLEKENESNANYYNDDISDGRADSKGGGEGVDEDGYAAGDLFKEIEMGLDRVCQKSSFVGGEEEEVAAGAINECMRQPQGVDAQGKSTNKNKAGAVWNGTCKLSQASNGTTALAICHSSVAAAPPLITVNATVTDSNNTIAKASYVHNSNTTSNPPQVVQVNNTINHASAIVDTINQCQTIPESKVSEVDEFDDEDDDDFAAIDLSVSLTQPNNPQPTNNSTINTGSDEFDDGNDDDFAAIDLFSAMTQGAVKQHNVNTYPTPLCNNENVPNMNNAASANQGEFDEFDDDLDDLAAIDLAAAMIKSNNTLPPQQLSSANNRRYMNVANSNGSQPTYLSFTRYVIRRMEEDFSTNTKTLAVGIWTSKEDIGRKNELDQLRRICEENDPTTMTSTTNTIDGCIHLRGVWFYTQCNVGDVVHLCSISGQYMTDSSVLPVVLDSGDPQGNDSQDDLVLVIHPDVLITPTLVSEAVDCSRLAVLQSRLGSTGLSAKPAIIGTLRHDLFERCIREHDATRQSAARYTRQIIRNHAETLVGCGITDQREAFGEVMKTLPQIQTFLTTYTSWDASKSGQMKLATHQNDVPSKILEGMFASCDTLFSMEGVYSTEEWAMCPELGLKGNVDATVLARTKHPSAVTAGSNSDMRDALMPVELKTGHSQNPRHSHLAQLSVYTIMLRARHGSATSTSRVESGLDTMDGVEMGAANSGILLYLNDKSFHARHVKPALTDVKHLIGHRNEVVCNVLRAARPRGVALEYEEPKNGGKYKIVVEPPPPSALPTLNPKVQDCERCYKNRECMMYSVADSSDTSLPPCSNGPSSTHRRLMRHFTGHLKGADLDYFRKWDRMIDLERHATSTDIAKSWLIDSSEKEATDGKCISSLQLDEAALSAECDDTKDSKGSDERATLHFTRPAATSTSLLNLSLEVGSYVILSTDGTIMSNEHPSPHRTYRQKMHILRGSVIHLAESSVGIIISRRDIGHIKRLVKSSTANNPSAALKFRLDKDELSNGAGLLLQNLVNFLTLDIPSFSSESQGTTPVKTKQFTADTDYSIRRRRLQSAITQLTPHPRFSTISADSLFLSDSFCINVPGCELASLKRDFATLNPDQKGAVLKVRL